MSSLVQKGYVFEVQKRDTFSLFHAVKKLLRMLLFLFMIPR